ncbi:energy transducer TonB family protein [Novosphingobium mangrovi (ex Huang et al. 2023)]|uniref:TonB family protein n=1 Tax=Novosphingobium mangrovi (ex Huang et al. 2023) TaxID=2976432 RepID=A0ABT2I6F1_9SPHN|nr:energy transducer TonB [Novosphingobium mangrovi (ex Huang et al. 2023)]MCT2400373.1 TonB family protein [Novosphingobium mangrovi (ex Huang et al. 2023)]
MSARPAFAFEDREPGRYAPGRRAFSRKGGAIAASLLLNMLLLAGVVAAMRGPRLLPTGERHALVSIALRPEPRHTTPPPSAPKVEASGRQDHVASLPVPEEKPARVLLAKPGATPPSASLPQPLVPEIEPPAPAASRPAPTPSPEAAADVLDAYRQQIWNRILAARPRGARGSGTVQIRFRIDRNGALLSADIVGSSGRFMLDRMALQAVRRAAPFPPPPESLGTPPLAFTVPVAFH